MTTSVIVFEQREVVLSKPLRLVFVPSVRSPFVFDLNIKSLVIEFKKCHLQNAL